MSTEMQRATHAAASLAPLAPWLDRAAYPFPARFMNLSAGRVHYIDEGHGTDGVPLVFVHGTPTWSFEFRHLVRALRGSHRCIALDHLGFGLSERPLAFGYRPEDHARTFAAFIAALGVERCTLVVHDFGGPIALPFALEHPDRIERLVVINSFMWPIDDATLARQARLAGSFVGRLLYRYLNFSQRVLMPYAYADKRRLSPAIHRQYLAPFRKPAAREQVLWALARSLLASAAHYQKLWQARARLAQIPSLVLWGTKDRAFPGAFRGPLARGAAARGGRAHRGRGALAPRGMPGHSARRADAVPRRDTRPATRSGSTTLALPCLCPLAQQRCGPTNSVGSRKKSR